MRLLAFTSVSKFIKGMVLQLHPSVVAEIGLCRDELLRSAMLPGLARQSEHLGQKHFMVKFLK